MRFALALFAITSAVLAFDSEVPFGCNEAFDIAQDAKGTSFEKEMYEEYIFCTENTEEYLKTMCFSANGAFLPSEECMLVKPNWYKE